MSQMFSGSKEMLMEIGSINTITQSMMYHMQSVIDWKFFSCFFAIFLLNGCGKEYREINSKFPEREIVEGDVFPKSRVVFVTTPGALYEIRRSAEVVINDEIIQLSDPFPFHGKIQLKSKDVLRCEKICFSDDHWQAKLVLSDEGSFVGVFNNRQVLDWCEKNNISFASKCWNGQ